MKIERKEEEIRSKLEALNEVERCEKGIMKLNRGVKLGGIALLMLMLTILVTSINSNLGLVFFAAFFVMLLVSVLFGGFGYVLKGWGLIFVITVNFFPFYLLDIGVGFFVLAVLASTFFVFPVLHFLAARAILKANLKEAKGFIEFYSKEMEKEEIADGFICAGNL